MRRAYDATHINRVVNHPEVFKWVSMPGIDVLDLSAAVTNPDNVLLENEHGGFIFIRTGGGHYEVHTQFLPSGRGQSLQAAREAAEYMFTQTDCVAIDTYVPDGNIGALNLAKAMNFTYTGRDGSWTYPDGRTVAVDWFTLTKDQWICRQQP